MVLNWYPLWKCIVGEPFQLLIETHGRGLAFQSIYQKVIQDIKGEGSFGLGDAGWEQSLSKQVQVPITRIRPRAATHRNLMRKNPLCVHNGHLEPG